MKGKLAEVKAGWQDPTGVGSVSKTSHRGDLPLPILGLRGQRGNSASQSPGE